MTKTCLHPFTFSSSMAAPLMYTAPRTVLLSVFYIEKTPHHHYSSKYARTQISMHVASDIIHMHTFVAPCIYLSFVIVEEISLQGELSCPPSSVPLWTRSSFLQDYSFVSLLQLQAPISWLQDNTNMLMVMHQAYEATIKAVQL